MAKPLHMEFSVAVYQITSRGNASWGKCQFGQAISDYIKTLEIKPKYALPYYNRVRTNYCKDEYNKSWEDIKKVQDLGLKVPPKILHDLQKASERQN